MKDVHNIERDFLFKDKIYEITSISVEEDHEINSSKIEGFFIVSGDYRIHEISINKEDFSFKIPFVHELRSNINLDTIGIDITDFTYDVVEDNLTVNIEYIIKAENSLIEFETEQSLDDFLEHNTVEEIIDLSPKEEIIKPKLTPQVEERKSSVLVESNEIIQPADSSNIIPKETFIEEIKPNESYIKYHIHIVNENDTIESITSKYNITINELKRYNTFDNLELYMKLIIPESDDE